MKAFALGMFCAVVFTAPAFAQASFLRQISRTGLVQEDVNIMVQRGSELYVGGGAAVGDDTIWQNPDTGAHGLVEITGVDGNCVQIAYKFQTRRAPSPQTLNSQRCLTDGRWVQVP